MSPIRTIREDSTFLLKEDEYPQVFLIHKRSGKYLGGVSYCTGGYWVTYINTDSEPYADVIQEGSRDQGIEALWKCQFDRKVEVKP